MPGSEWKSQSLHKCRLRPDLLPQPHARLVRLEDVRKDDIPLVGGKCANLGELTAKGVHVPPGFAVAAEAFRLFLEETKIGEIIHKTLEAPTVPGTRNSTRKHPRKSGKF